MTELGLIERRSLDAAVLRCAELLSDPELPTVKAWQAAGGRVVAHFPVYFPHELAHAAGALPVLVRGSRTEAAEAASRFGSSVCSIPKSSLELALTGSLRPDLMVTPAICDTARNLAGVWSRNLEHASQVLYFPQNPTSAGALDYLSEEYRRLLSDLASLVDREVTDDDLGRSLVVFNTNRRLLHALAQLRRDAPWLVSGFEAYVLSAIGGLLPREEHNALLTWALAELQHRDRQAQDRLRIVLDGGFCEAPPLPLLHVLDATTYLVDDDLTLGMRWLRSDVPLTGDPITNLARAYLDDAGVVAVQHDPRRPRSAELVARVGAAEADAVVLAAAKMCEPALAELVAHGAALEAAGIPHFLLDFEEHMTGFDDLQLQLDTFVDNLLLL